MKSLGAALISALLVAVGGYYGLVHSGLDTDLAAEIAAATMAAVPYIREFLIKTFSIQQNSLRAPVLPFSGFGLPPQRMILYGTLTMAGAMVLGSGLAGITVRILGETRERHTFYLIGIVASLIQFPIIFSVGRWIGRRCASHDAAVIFLSSFFARLIATGTDFSLLTPAKMTALSGIHITPVSLILLIAQGTATIALIRLIGYWRGRLQRLAAYLTYLLPERPRGHARGYSRSCL